MIRNLLFSIYLFSLLFASESYAQKWIDSSYAIQISQDISYGKAIDFAGQEQNLSMDIALPLGDSIPRNGRPLLLSIHGGAFMAGTKNDANPQRWMKDFAAKGYVSASVNYRLGMFQTEQYRNCNITWLFNTPWNCSNMSDSLEWYRSYFRAVQDVKGALRYLALNADTYNINPDMFFLIGESAGAFVAIGTGFLDSLTEKHAAQFAVSTVAKPNNLYESCSPILIDSMKLNRGDLGSIEGNLNSAATAYKIKAVASFSGAMFNNLFETNSKDGPNLLYLFHQPNDLIVPYDYAKILKGYSDCAQNLGSCANIISRPMSYGSFGIKKQIDTLKTLGVKYLPKCVLETTSNTADCFQQINNPYLNGHQVDNYGLRTQNVAILFAQEINTYLAADTLPNDTSVLATENIGAPSLNDKKPQISIHPNPAVHFIELNFTSNKSSASLAIYSLSGKLLFKKEQLHSGAQIQFQDALDLDSGLYIVQIQLGEMRYTKKLLRIRE